MKKPTLISLAIILFALVINGCTEQVTTPQSVINPTPTPSTDSTNVSVGALDQLLADKAFTAVLKSRVQLTDEQIAALKKLSSDEVARLGPATTENKKNSEEEARARVLKSMSELLGEDKTKQVMALAIDRLSMQPETTAAKDSELTMLKGPNAVPSDTRIVVNIPAFRMDMFKDGTLLKSYRIGIGYQQFPLPTGFRKAEMIIFNPTWTQPNESWASNPGAVVPAGDKGNPLGPIKIPIGGANLIHGGKALAKIGTFASHGCVGLTNDEVKDFARVLADATNTELKESTMEAYLKKKTRTQVVKLSKVVPVELRYETIVIEDGKLHVYRDVYNKNTNTEENLRAVFEANGGSFDKLSEDEKQQALDAVNAMSLHPKKSVVPKPAVAANQNSADRRALAAERKAEAERQRKLRNQKEIVIDLTSVSTKGYPPPKDLHTGAGSAASNAGAPKLPPPRKNPTPALQSSPEAGQPPRNTAVPPQ